MSSSRVDFEEGLFLYERGLELVEREDWREALLRFKKALDVFKRIGSELDVSLCLKTLEKICGYFGNWVEAAEYLEKDLEIQRRCGNEEELIGDIEKLAACHIRSYNFEKAIGYLDQMRDIFEKSGQLERVFNILGYLGRVYEKMGDLEQALSNYKAAFGLGEKLSLPGTIELNAKIQELTSRKKVELSVSLETLYVGQREASKTLEPVAPPFEIRSVGGVQVKPYTEDYAGVLSGRGEAWEEKSSLGEEGEKMVAGERGWVPSVGIPRGELKLGVDIEYEEFMELNKEHVLHVVLEGGIAGSGSGLAGSLVVNKILDSPIEMLLFAPYFDVGESHGRVKISNTGEPAVFQFKIIPRTLGRQYLSLEFYGKGRLLRKVVLAAFVKGALDERLETRKRIELRLFPELRSDTTLRIHRFQNRFHFYLFTKYADKLTSRGAKIGESELDAKTSEMLQLRMRDIAFNSEDSQMIKILIEVGEGVYSLIPKGINSSIRILNPKYFTIETDDLFMPFELAYDEKNFFCLKYNLGKRILPDGDYEPPATIGAGKLRIKLVIEEPLGETMMCEKEFLEDLKANNLIALDEVLEQASREQFELILSQDFDIIHLHCKVVFNETEPTEPKLLLSDSSLNVKEIENLKIQGNPIIFADISGETEPREGSHKFIGLARIAKAFLNSGASAFIGPLWRIPDRLKIEIVIKFYEKTLLDGKPLGAIIREIKNELQEHPGTYWAALNLYGDPNLKIIHKKQQL